MNQLIHKINAYPLRWQWLKVICLSILYLGHLFLSTLNFYAQKLRTVFYYHFIKALLIWLLFIVIIILFTIINQQVHQYTNLINQIKNDNSHIQTTYYQVVINGQFQWNQLSGLINLEHPLIVALNHNASISHALYVGKFLTILSFLRTIYGLSIIILIVTLIGFWHSLSLVWMKIQPIQFQIVCFLETLINPFGPIFSCYWLKKSPIHYQTNHHSWGEINLAQAWVIAWKWLWKRNKNQPVLVNFGDTTYDQHEFVHIKNLVFAYHQNIGWQKWQHWWLKKINPQKYHQHMIERNSLLHPTLKNEQSKFQPVLNNLNLKIKQHSFNTLIGANGSGKTTLIKAIINNLKHYQGNIEWAGANLNVIDLQSFAKNVAIISQNYQFHNSMRVYDFVAFGRTPYLKLLSFLSPQDHEIIQKALAQTNIAHLSQKLVSELSGGQQQKVLIAMALAQETDTIILDEPTTYLDIRNQYELLEMLKQMHMDHKTIIAILHDLNQTSQYAEHVILLHQGQIYDQGEPNQVINEKNLQTLFGINAQFAHFKNKKYLTKIT